MYGETTGLGQSNEKEYRQKGTNIKGKAVTLSEAAALAKRSGAE